MSAYFITATGTGIGKTVLTTALAYQLKEKGRNVMAVKPVISGFEDGDLENDTALIAASLGLSFNTENIRKISPFRYRAAISPNLAAAIERREIEPEALLDFCDKTISSHDTTLIEGIGGTHVPLAEDFLVADWIHDLELPTILVTGSYLGALSHTLVSVEALLGMGINIAAIVVSQSEDQPMPFAETVTALMEQLPDQKIFSLPRIEKEPLFKNAPDLTRILD